jgi:hypothetical protein
MVSTVSVQSTGRHNLKPAILVTFGAFGKNEILHKTGRQTLGIWQKREKL